MPRAFQNQPIGICTWNAGHSAALVRDCSTRSPVNSSTSGALASPPSGGTRQSRPRTERVHSTCHRRCNQFGPCRPSQPKLGLFYADRSLRFRLVKGFRQRAENLRAPRNA
jgi:hypothetical protein